MTLDIQSLSLLQEALERLESGFTNLPPFQPDVDLEALRAVLLEVAERMKDNFPYPHPFYAGQMVSPPHPIARLAYALAQYINPNNHALDGGRASSAMEKEAVAQIAAMFGWQTFLGHLCGGGTMANLEALWVAKRLHPGKKVVASAQAHYTHARISEVLALPFESIPTNDRAQMDEQALEAALQTGQVGTVVATIGTTATGSVDPLPRLLELQAEYKFRIHADAAYGGYFTLIDDLEPETRAAYDVLPQVDSIAIDPHKHGLQPYGCGCILFREPGVGRFYKHDSPYTYFSSAELHLGEISLECSRPGAAAVALWATQRLLPPVRGGAFAADLTRARQAALALHAKARADSRFLAAFAPELDIVVWAPRADRSSAVSQLARATFEAAAAENLHLALVNLPEALLRSHWPDLAWDQDHVTCLRSCLMRPEHLEWIDRIWEALGRAISRVHAAHQSGDR